MTRPELVEFEDFLDIDDILENIPEIGRTSALYWDYALSYFENLMPSFGFINVTYDLSRNFGFVDCSSFSYNQKRMQIFYASARYRPCFRGAQ